MTRTTRIAARLLSGGLFVTLTSTAAAQTPKEFFACYVPGTAQRPGSGTVYRIKEPMLLQACLRGHIQFNWIDGIGAVRTGDPAGGDLAGTYPNPTVARLQGRAVSSTAPTDGQVLAFDGTSNTWKPAALLNGTIADHGQLAGLLDDDHPQYLLRDGVRASVNGFAVTGTLASGAIPATGAGVRLMWYPGKAAFRAGEVGSEWDDAQVGSRSVAMGQQTTASGQAAIAFGQTTIASGGAATALGSATHASGSASTAMGANSNASGNFATAMGSSTVAGGDYSTASGNSTSASGSGSTAMGSSSNAIGTSAVAIGSSTTASGNFSVALGFHTTASGESSTALGSESSAGGAGSLAVGLGVIASSSGSLAVGGGSTASGVYSRALGNSSTASGDYATAIGPSATATGNAATAIGFQTVASGASALALGQDLEASGDHSIALGRYAFTNAQEGSFVYGDNSTFGTQSYVQATAPNQFVVRAAGGFQLRSNSSLSTGCDLPAGSGSWNCTSSIALKTNFEPVDGEEILARVRELRVQRWSYQSEPGVRHLGTFAEDFHRMFGLGTGESTIGMIDMDGVNLAATQALERRTRELRAQLEDRDREIGLLRAEVEELRQRMARLEANRQ